MTRTDFLNDLDTWHIINIDRYHNVRPDSRLMLNVFRDIASQGGFQEDVRFPALPCYAESVD